MSTPTEQPADWNIRLVPWLAPGSVVPFDGEDLALASTVQLGMQIGHVLGKGGQAAVFDIRANVGSDVSWAGEDVVLRVSYRDDEYGRDPRRTRIYRRLAAIRSEAPAGADPLAGLLKLYAVGNLPPPDYLPKVDLWAQVLDRGGTTLSGWVGGDHGPLGAQDGVAAMLPMSRALARCHAEGIAHRDIKPSNVFVSPRATGGPTAWLGDLGSLSRFPPPTDPLVTMPVESVDPEVQPASGIEMGHDLTTNIDTGPFTPPEVRTSPHRSPANPAGDIWQYAVTLHYACAGDLPFLGWRSRDWTTNSKRYIEACLDGEPNSPAFSGLPDRLQYILRWCLACEPYDRPRAADLVEALEDFQQDSGVIDPDASTQTAPAEAWVRGSAVNVRFLAQEPSDLMRDFSDRVHDPFDLLQEPSHQANEPSHQANWLSDAEEPSDHGNELSDADDYDDADAAVYPFATGAALAVPVDPAVSREVPIVPEEVGWRSGWTRLALAIVASVAAAVVLVALIYQFLTRDPTARPPAAAQTQTAVTSSAAESTEVPPFSVSSLIIRPQGSHLEERLPQLFTDTALRYRPVLGTLQTESFQFCTSCAEGLVRLRASVTIDQMYTEQRLNEGVPGDRIEGPYVVLVTNAAAQVPQPPLTGRLVRRYPMPAEYATPGSFDTVYLVPSNPSGVGEGESAGDTSWQTKLRNQADGPSTLVFDIPNSTHFATILWFTPDGVVGFNRFSETEATAQGESASATP